MRQYDMIEEALKKIDKGSSGGCTPYNEIAFFERIKPSQGCVWNATRWFESEKYPDEEVKIITLYLCRKKKLSK